MDVKYVPTVCYAGSDGEKFFQYSMIDEATLERFIYAYKEQSGFSTVDFVKRAIIYFGYVPKVIQTDNGAEFTNFSRTKRVHIFDKFCQENGIEHKLIRPRTPWHNGKVERSHRSDQERFYNHLSFYILRRSAYSDETVLTPLKPYSYDDFRLEIPDTKAARASSCRKIAARICCGSQKFFQKICLTSLTKSQNLSRCKQRVHIEKFRDPGF